MKELKINKWYGDYLSRSISLNRGKETLEISFANNLDLYFSFHSLNNTNDFLISKDNYEVWEAFDMLYHNIIEANIYHFTQSNKDHTANLALIDGKNPFEEIKREEQLIKEMNANLKKWDAYQRLTKNNQIKWCSDDFRVDIAPYFVIEPLNDCYKISFEIPQNEKKLSDEEEFALGYQRDSINIRLRNSGSNYHPFNLAFMDLFYKLMAIDLEEYHQIHIEEYLTLKRTKK